MAKYVRDVSSEQELVCQKWKLVHANIKVDNAMKSFLTQSLEVCGQTLATEAFDLVRQVLNPRGYVRNENKGELSDIGSILSNEESTWMQQGKPIHTKWDFEDRWLSGQESWQENYDCNDNKSYYKLDAKIVNDYCELNKTFVQDDYLSRIENVRYENETDNLDETYSIPKIDKNGDFICKVIKGPVNDENGKFISRWETICAITKKEDDLNKDKTETEEQKQKTLELLENMFNDKKFKQLQEQRGDLEPYWRFALRVHNSKDSEIAPDSADNTLRKQYFETDNLVDYRECGNTDKPMLVLKIGYFVEETGLFKQRCVICEIDKYDKTKADKKSLISSNLDAMKLALKLMTANSIQSVLQPETYHIRSNFFQYDQKLIQKSLLSTTNVELPNFQEFLDKLQQKTNQTSDIDKFQTALHFIHHMYVAHIKIAFLIYMREVHDIDMLCTDNGFAQYKENGNRQMRNHCFFVNSKGMYLPSGQLTFENKMHKEEKEMMRSSNMLLFPIQIKFFDGTRPCWTAAPVASASTERAQMRLWSSKVRSMQLPDFPMEEMAFLPVTVASVQRVNIKELIAFTQRAASESHKDYWEARELKIRDGGATQQRKFPDRCFLSRYEQLDRNESWNKITDKTKRLRQRKEKENEDDIEFCWGYENPNRTRQYELKEDRWDQVDVRMFFFHSAMSRTSWREVANGMWYIPDIIDFMCMLQKLDIEVPIRYNDVTFTNKTTFPDHTINNAEYSLPSMDAVKDRAYHKFSILSWFFDCRDAGSCRYKWEEYVLSYFGARTTSDTSEFEKFLFLDTNEMLSNTQKYFGNPWFEICFFLQRNFRNALAPIYYKWREADDKMPIRDLQENATNLYNRQKSLLNQRSSFVGLQFQHYNGPTMLSFQRFDAKFNPNMTLRERIFSRLHNEFPQLDPFLQTYIKQFNIPDVELFLRMIRCPNVLALRELAIQHRHVLGAQATSGAKQSQTNIQKTLEYFPISVQSEILFLFKFIESDDSVYVHTPAIHATKRVLLSQSLMRKWVRETLEVATRVHTLKTPLQYKFYMFTMQNVTPNGLSAFSTFKKLFYTTESLTNVGSQRSILFILLQMRLLLLTLKSADKLKRENPLMNFSDEKNDLSLHYSYQTNIYDDEWVQWTVGSSMYEWPRRDQNEFVRIHEVTKNKIKDVNEVSRPYDSQQEHTYMGLKYKQGKDEGRRFEHGISEQELTKGAVYEMTHTERCLWLLLMYARPGLAHFTAEDGTSVCQEQEWIEQGKKSKRDISIMTLSYDVGKKHLECVVVDNVQTYIYFECVSKGSKSTNRCIKSFPPYIEAIINFVPERQYIYIPVMFAKELRADVPDLWAARFEYGERQWEMVCVGTRAWAWKRLLVKYLLYETISKIMTRDSVQLSLYLPETLKKTNNYMQEVIAMHKVYTTIFGELDQKITRLNGNLQDKLAQFIFTLHTKQHRSGSIQAQKINYIQTKIETLTRQMKWVRYCQNEAKDFLVLEAKSCRYMFIDKRIATGPYIHHKHDQIEIMSESDVLLYRDYIFLKEEQKSMLIIFRGLLYIKFPFGFSVMRSSTTPHTIVVGSVKDETTTKCFATFLDTRTYDGLVKKRQRKADSQEMMEIIAECTGKRAHRWDNWSSTQDITENTTSWIYKSNNNVLIKLNVKNTIDCELQSPDCTLSSSDQVFIYSLPDFFSRNGITKQIIEDKCTQNTENVWTEDILTLWKDNDVFDPSVRRWNELRSTSKFINMGKTNNVTNYLSLEHMVGIDHDDLKKTLLEIHRRIRPNADTDSNI